MLGILELLTQRGYAAGAKAKFVRHQTSALDIEEIVRRGWLEAYQSYQSKAIFDGIQYIISFVGEAGRDARFIGVYAVEPAVPSAQGVFPEDCPYVEWKSPDHPYYPMRRQPQFDDLRDRVVIDWGPAPLSWHQHAQEDRDKEILEIRRPGRNLAAFDDYMEVSLTHDNLVDLFARPESHPDWRSRLQAVAGVYLISDRETGDLYVGSAYGAGGIWGRWSSYARNDHGGNKMLGDIIRADPGRVENFDYSLLHILPKTHTRKDVIRWEARFKDKLGTRARGLNLN